MTLRDRSDRVPTSTLFWRAMFWTAVWLGMRAGKFAYDTGVADGKSQGWREANEMIADHRTRYDPQPVSAGERLRREADRAARSRGLPPL
jgi:hypothetical protein